MYYVDSYASPTCIINFVKLEVNGERVGHFVVAGEHAGHLALAVLFHALVGVK